MWLNWGLLRQHHMNVINIAWISQPLIKHHMNFTAIDQHHMKFIKALDQHRMDFM